MPQGMQIWDASGNLIVDTSKLVLRQLNLFNVAASTTSEQSIPIDPDSSNVVIAILDGGASSISGSQIAQARIDSGFLKYKFEAVGDFETNISALVF